MYIISCQIHHRSSVALFKDADLLYYNECSRLTRKKHSRSFSGLEIEKIKSIVGLDPCILILTGYDAATPFEVDTFCKYFEHYKVSIQECISFSQSHHLCHAARAFFASGFEEATIIVWDGRGSNFNLSEENCGYETTSIFTFDKSQNFKCIYKRLFVRENFNDTLQVKTNLDLTAKYEKKLPYTFDDQTVWHITDKHDIGKVYNIITGHVGFDRRYDHEGKTMGLQSYGSLDSNIITYNSDGQINFKEDLIKKYQKKEFLFYINEEKYTHLNSKNHQALKDLAYTGQQVIQAMGEKTIEYALRNSAKTTQNVVFTGGVSLNVVANNAYREKFAKNINFYIEPLCGDEGNSIGAGILFYYDLYKKGKFSAFTEIKNKFINRTLYIGESNLNTDIHLHPKEKMFDCADMSIAAAQLLEQGHLVSIFHGKAEAGPRALGNRSILFDPRKINGKDIVNSVKMREYFRPFAFTMMAEYANEWFYMNGLQESPFMMYAVKVKEQYKNRIPAVIHVDNTCRIQTVKKEQNPILYELLFEFYKKTDIPGVLNTSFNLAGDPIVETIEDALNTLRRSQLEYLFLPEIKKMIFIQNNEKIQ